MAGSRPVGGYFGDGQWVAQQRDGPMLDCEFTVLVDLEAFYHTCSIKDKAIVLQRFEEQLVENKLTLLLEEWRKPEHGKYEVTIERLWPGPTDTTKEYKCDDDLSKENAEKEKSLASAGSVVPNQNDQEAMKPMNPAEMFGPFMNPDRLLAIQGENAKVLLDVATTSEKHQASAHTPDKGSEHFSFVNRVETRSPTTNLPNSASHNTIQSTKVESADELDSNLAGQDKGTLSTEAGTHGVGLGLRSPRPGSPAPSNVPTTPTPRPRPLPTACPSRRFSLEYAHPGIFSDLDLAQDCPSESEGNSDVDYPSSEIGSLDTLSTESEEVQQPEESGEESEGAPKVSFVATLLRRCTIT
ncbi:hypothetical protein TWF281_011619 [Arthrobotrys megalospora]